MSCPGFVDASPRLLGFTVRYQLNGVSSGTVMIAAPQCGEEAADPLACGTGGVCTPIQLSLGAVTSVPCGDCPDYSGDPCFSEDPDWIAGLIQGQGIEGIYNGMPALTYTVAPYSSYLDNKPINTQLFRGWGVSSVLTEVADVYAGIPAALRDFNPVNNGITGPVVGNSVMQELKLLAAAGYSHLFTQVGGVLTVEQWKTNNDPVEYTIPQSLIFNVKKQPVTPNRVSFIRARGAGVTKYECGKQIMTDARVDGTAPGGYSSIGGTLTSTAISGIKTPSLDLSLDNLAASKEDIRNAEWEAETASPGALVEADDGSLKTEITKDDGTWFDDTETEFKIQISGKRRPKYEADGVSAKVRPSSQEQRALEGKDHDRWAVITPHPMPQGSFFSEALPFGAADPTYDAGSESIEQIETLIADARVSSCGYKMEQISNKYSDVKEHLFLQGVRRFQEMRMRENTYVIEMAYMPCLKLNQVIEFEVSNVSGCAKSGMEKGVIAGIDVNMTVNQDGTPDVKMTLTVWSLDCIGSNLYTSANLMINRCAGSEAGGSNPWTTSALGLDGHATVDGNCGFLYGAGTPAFVWFRLDHTDFSIGDTYTFSFEYTQLEGVEPFSLSWPGGSTSLAGTGSFSIPFVPAATTGSFQWTVAFNSFPNAYKICDMQITKTVTA